ncbi:MAG: histidine--tRNA ligase [Chloroflexota bacterium]
MIQPQVLRGMRDFLPEQMILRQRIMATFREIFERHGFEPIETPVLEYLEVLTGNLDDEKLMYHFEDQGGREVGMRYDLTVPFARFVALHRNELTFPFKRYHIAPVWRADRPQRGRYREFWQCDADIVGATSMLADADVVSIFVEALSAINMPDFAVHINHRKLLEAMAEVAGVEESRAGHVYRSIDKLDKIGADGVIDEMVKGGIAADVAGRMVDFTTYAGPPDAVLSWAREQLAGREKAARALNELEELFDHLAALGVEPAHYRFDLSLARGLAYYTGPVYEARVEEFNVGSLGGAGRYDGLVGRFSKQDMPATGISLGLERIIDVVGELGLMSIERSVSQVLVTIFDDDGIPDSLRLSTELRSAGLRVETYLEPKRNLGRQFRYADQKGIKFALVLGPDEREKGVVAVKDLGSGDQVDVGRAEITRHLMDKLNTA